MANMKEALVDSKLSVQVVDSPIPQPQADQIVIKVVVSGSNPKDAKRALTNQKPWNTGDDIAGVVHAVGPNVSEFKVGDRVAAFHEVQEPHGSFAEYAVAWSHTTFHIPDKTTYEEAATVPLASMTAATMLYQNLGLPIPWRPATKPTPVIIYGASGAVGSFAVQLALESNLHPLICVAGKSASHVEKMIDKSKGDTVLDYRVGPEQLAVNLGKAIEQSGTKCHHAVDTICLGGSFDAIAKVVDPEGSKIAVILPSADYSSIPQHVAHEITYVGSVHGQELASPAREKASGTQSGDKDFAYAVYRLIARGLEKGWFKGHPYEVVPGGLTGVEQGLKDLHAGKANAVKYVFRIGDTPGAAQ